LAIFGSCRDSRLSSSPFGLDNYGLDPFSNDMLWLDQILLSNQNATIPFPIPDNLGMPVPTWSGVGVYR
jgi:hypothetical protein